MSVDIRYFKYPLSQTFIKSNFFFVPISTPGNSRYKFGRYLKRRYPEFSLGSLSSFSGWFSSAI